MLMRGYAKFVLIGLLILGLFCGGAVGAPNIDSSSPATPLSTFVGVDPSFSVTVNETCNITWYMNGSNMQAVVNQTTDAYSNTTAPAGVYNVTAVADNLNGTVQKEWLWTVNYPAPIVTLASPAVSISDFTGNSRTFTATINQVANITWILDGTTLFTNNTTQTALYHNASAQLGIHNLTVFAKNANGTDQKKWTWTVSNAPTPVITLSSPATSFSDNTGNSKTFSATVSQVANVTWILDGTTLFTNNTTQAVSYYNASAHIGNHNLTVFAENTNGTDQKKWDWNVTNVSLGIIGFAPTTANPESTVGDTQMFNVTTNQNSTIKWYIDGGASVQTNTSVQMASYVNSVASIGSYNITAIATNVNGTDQKKWDWNVRSKTFYTGDLIWDALSSQSPVYTWTARSYSGFYYDLDSDVGSETLTITQAGGSVASGGLVYTTTSIDTKFEYTTWGSYKVTGFMAEKYFAGYPVGAFGITSSIDLMSRGQLSKVLIDRDKSQSIYSGAGLILEEGYVLHVDEVDINGNNVMVTLQKDGSEITSDIVAGGGDFVYKKQLGSTNNVPIIAVHFKNIFRGTETNAVFVDGIFQISDEYTAIRTGDTYGKMKVTNVASGNIKMENSNSFSLSQGSTIDIMGNLKFIVADDNTLRFTPFVDMSKPGSYELRGTVTNNTGYKWTPLNFEGFYYNIDEGISTESLEVVSLSGSSIASNDLVYTTTPAPVSFDYSGWTTKYDVAGFMAEKYFAGYSTAPFGTSSTVSMISKGQLSKVLIDGSDSRSIYSGAGLILDEGYVLHIDEVDINGNNVLVTLQKDGSDVKTDIVGGGGDFVYAKQIGSTRDVPMIAVHFKNIFRGSESNAVFVDGIFQISDQYITVEVGETYGKMEVTSTSGKIEMKNDNSITLLLGQTIPIMGDILFKVADDSNNVRYYPYVEIETAPLESLEIDIPSSVKQGDYVTVAVTSRGATVSDVAVKFDDDNIGKTSAEGTISYRPSLSGMYTITAEKSGYISASGEIEVISPMDETKKMSIEVYPEIVYEGNQLTISVIKAIGGEAIEDVDVSYDGRSLGTTSSDGTLSYTVKETGMHKLIATKTGHLDAELNLEVLALEAKFEFSNLVISPLEVKMGKDVTITLDTSNTGKAAGDYNIDLMVNGNLTGSQEVTLVVGNSTTIEFTVAKDEPGTYLVEVNGLSGTFVVLEKAGGTAIYVLGILGIFAAAAVGYMFTAGGWTVEMVTAKVAEFIESVR